jgi:hypothetical protein
MAERPDFYGTGIADERAARRYLRDKFGQRPLEPIQRRPGARFYVTARLGQRTAFLLGPYASHMTALSNVERGRRLARDYRDTDLASYGTSSYPDTLPTLFGR